MVTLVVFGVPLRLPIGCKGNYDPVPVPRRMAKVGGRVSTENLVRSPVSQHQGNMIQLKIGSTISNDARDPWSNSRSCFGLSR